MHPLPARQVHLDFHNSQHLTNIGARFNKTQFQKALKTGRVQSITLFAKCHHSWSYYPTKIGRIHPNLNFDLLGRQIRAAHEIKVRTPIYLTVGWSANDAITHPHWRAIRKDGAIATCKFDVLAKPADPMPNNAWINMCPATPYRDLILAQTRELCELYPIDGFFYDICNNTPCFCADCQTNMRGLGLDPQSDEDEKTWNTIKWAGFITDCRAVILEHHPWATVFFNGLAENTAPDTIKSLQTHYELEHLPTVWGGYDKLALRSKSFSSFGKQIIAMSGKFHTQWGEFGGFKHPDAIRHEAAGMIAFGAGCSFGDQLHPSGEMNPDTYRNIGQAYRYVEQIESFGLEGFPCANLGIFPSGHAADDQGIAAMLLESHIDFDVVQTPADLPKFQTVILPGGAVLNEESAAYVLAYLMIGGSVVALADSVFENAPTRRLLIEVGEFLGPANFDVDYTMLRKTGRPSDKSLAQIRSQTTPFFNPISAVRFRKTHGTILADVHEPFFNRTYQTYSSHMHAPNQLKPAAHFAAVRNDRLIYLAHPLGRMYLAQGSRLHREYFIGMVRRLHTRPSLMTKLPAAARVNVIHQPLNKRYVVHMLYAPPIQRGKVSVLEDFPVLRDIPLAIRAPERIKRVRLPLIKKRLPWARRAGRNETIVPELSGHQIVTFEY